MGRLNASIFDPDFRGPSGTVITRPSFYAHLAYRNDYIRHAQHHHSLTYREVAMSLRIFLINKHGPARKILARRLASMPGLDVVGSTSNGEEAIRDITGLNPDVVLIDIKMKQADGIDLCHRALTADDQANVAVLTSYLDPDERRQAYQAGVNSYLPKDVDTVNLASWIRLTVDDDSEDPEI